MAARGFSRPILVGGGAVEFYTGSALMTGDIDVTSPVQPELEQELQRLGFIRPSGAGKSLRGWVHPDLGLGFEIVASSPMGGGVEADRIRLVRPAGETARFRILGVEDMIADRMGQFASGTAPDMRPGPGIARPLSGPRSRLSRAAGSGRDFGRSWHRRHPRLKKAKRSTWPNSAAPSRAAARPPAIPSLPAIPASAARRASERSSKRSRRPAGNGDPIRKMGTVPNFVPCVMAPCRRAFA